MNDRDIRKFIHDNEIKVHDSEKFMREVQRQLELLPSQSAMSEKENNILLIKAILQAKEKFSKRDVIFSMAINLFSLFAIGFLLLYMLPLAGGTSKIIDAIINYRYIIMSGFFLLSSSNILVYFTKTYRSSF